MGKSFNVRRIAGGWHGFDRRPLEVFLELIYLDINQVKYNNMFFNNACLALGGLYLSISLQYIAAAPPRSSWGTMMNPFVAVSVSAGMAIEEASSPTITAWDTSPEQSELPKLTQSTKTSHSCNNIFCFPISPWPESEAQPTSTSTPISAVSASACLQSRPSGQTGSAMKFNFTDTCDGASDMAEDCRVTLDCDASQGLYPTCERGECKCLAMACFRRSTCLAYRQCREFDDHACIKERHHNSTDGLGTCGCQPRVADCLFQESPHHYCAMQSNCTEKHFSLYPEFPYCSTGASQYPRGRCECRYFDCSRTGDERDYEVCKDLVDCGSSPLGSRPYCSLKYGDDGRGAEDGYCTCGS